MLSFLLKNIFTLLFMSVMHLCECMCACVYVCIHTHLWRSEDSFPESAPEFQPRDQTEVTRLGGRCPHSPSHSAITFFSSFFRTRSQVTQAGLELLCSLKWPWTAPASALQVLRWLDFLGFVLFWFRNVVFLCRLFWLASNSQHVFFLSLMNVHHHAAHSGQCRWVTKH